MSKSKPTLKDVEKSKQDKARDKKMGYKEGSKADMKADMTQLKRMKAAVKKKTVKKGK